MIYEFGLNRPLEGVTAKLVDHIDQSGCKIISIDVPSGVPVDQPTKESKVIHAHDTLSFQIFKLAFVMQENASFIGQVHLLDIGLAAEYYDSARTNYELVDQQIISSLYKPRNSFAHKGNF